MFFLILIFFVVVVGVVVVVVVVALVCVCTKLTMALHAIHIENTLFKVFMSDEITLKASEYANWVYHSRL